MKKSVALALVLGSGFFTGSAWAATDGSVLLPNTFTAGTPAQASEVNANFAALQGAANASNSRLTTAEGTLANHTSAITTNTTDIAGKQTRVSGSCASGNSIRVINGDGSVVCQADTVGGVTGVIAGTGLNGGGTTGEVTLFIPNGGITASHIANGSVGNLAIANGAITSGNIAIGAVGSAAIADGSIASVDIAPGAITASHLATGAVGSAALADGSISSADVAAGAVTSSHLTTGAVGSAAIADGSIASVDIAANSVTAANLANEPGVNYSGSGTLTTLLSTCNTSTSLIGVSITAPSSGYVHVSASGHFCTYTGNVYSMLMLDDAPGGALAYDGGNHVYDLSGASRGCGIGQLTPYVFENVYNVTGPGYYTYYVNGCVSVANNETLIEFGPMVATFYPTRY